MRDDNGVGRSVPEVRTSHRLKRYALIGLLSVGATGLCSVAGGLIGLACHVYNVEQGARRAA